MIEERRLLSLTRGFGHAYSVSLALQLGHEVAHLLIGDPLVAHVEWELSELGPPIEADAGRPEARSLPRLNGLEKVGDHDASILSPLSRHSWSR